MQMKLESTFRPSRTSRIDRPSPMGSRRCIDEYTTDHEPHFLQLTRILRRRRKLIATVAVLGAMLAGVLGLLIPPKYTATAQIVVEPQQAGPIGSRTEAPRSIDQSAIDTHVTMLASRAHLRRVLASLSDNSESAPILDKAASERKSTDQPSDNPPAPVAGNGALKSIETINTAAPALGDLSRRLKVWLGAIGGTESASGRELDELDRGLKVIQERTSRVLSVSITANNPDQAAAVVNRVVQLYVDDQAGHTRVQADQELAALDERAGHLKTELEKASEAMRPLLVPQLTAASSAGAEEKEADGRLRALERAAASSGQAYAGILQRQRELRGNQEIMTPEVRILSLASPPARPSSPNPLMFIFPAIVASLIGASLLAIVLEQLNQGLHNEHDVTNALGLPCIGLVPRLPRSHVDRPSHYLLSRPFTPYIEAIRSALATLHLGVSSLGPRVVLISSSVPGEGKTTLAVSLSVFAALLGKRVLLVDFDSRHPSVLRMLRGPRERPIKNLQDRPLEENIKHLAELNLDYLAIPRGPADPLAQFVGERMQHSLRRLRASYDCVFIDSSPLLGITETRLLATLVDSVIFVVKWGSTRREVVQNAGNVLRDALGLDGNNVVRASALVTQVNLKRHADYRYGDVGEAFVKYKKYYFGSVKA
jgi:succinoglycan biosynthesis transport protein ExoP